MAIRAPDGANKYYSFQLCIQKVKNGEVTIEKYTTINKRIMSLFLNIAFAIHTTHFPPLHFENQKYKLQLDVISIFSFYFVYHYMFCLSLSQCLSFWLFSYVLHWDLTTKAKIISCLFIFCPALRLNNKS